MEVGGGWKRLVWRVFGSWWWVEEATKPLQPFGISSPPQHHTTPQHYHHPSPHRTTPQHYTTTTHHLRKQTASSSKYDVQVVAQFSDHHSQVSAFFLFLSSPPPPIFSYLSLSFCTTPTYPLYGTQVWRLSWNVLGTVLSSAGDDGTIKLWQGVVRLLCCDVVVVAVMWLL